MKIAITMRETIHSAYYERRDALSQNWSEFFSETLPEVILIPLLNNPEKIVDTLDVLEISGVLLSNGNDWGESILRDETEKKIVNYCIGHGIPLLGICRGFQVLNLLFGGRIVNNLKKTGKGNHIAVDHRVNISCPIGDGDGSGLYTVNSFHNHGVTRDTLASPLKEFAVTRDDVIEGFYHKDKPVLGLQWHPERKNQSKDLDQILFQNFFRRKLF